VATGARLTDEQVRQALADLEARVRQRRRLLGETGADRAARDEVRAAADHWFVSAHLPITWETPVVGRALALAKRATRLLLRWYINPIVEQQNDYNAACARALVRLAGQQEALAQTLAEVEQRLRALEALAEGEQRPRALEEGRSAAHDVPAEGERGPA
jgi:hypothetical protein